VHVHLRGRQTDAFLGVHGLEHVIDQAAHAFIDEGHRLRHGAQARVGVFEDRQQCHGANGPVRLGVIAARAPQGAQCRLPHGPRRRNCGT
jgi:hypothetical protein